MLTIYKASAGSGKTFTLAFEYIKTLLGIKVQGTQTYRLNSSRYAPGGYRRPSRHRAILAITFTNAATEEMKSRIVRELASLSTVAGVEASLYGSWLMRDFGCTAAELAEAAALALAEMLYDYGSFNVSTIDSFFQTVLRTFSREVDHQGDYALQLDTRLMMKQSVAEMLDQINYMPRKGRSRLVEWVRSYSLGKMSEGKGYNFFDREGDILNSLTRAMADSLDEVYGEYAPRLREYLSDPERIEAFSDALRARIAASLEPVTASARSILSTLRAGGYPDEIVNRTILSRVVDAAAGRPVDVSVKTISDIADGVKEDKATLTATKLKAHKLKADDVADLASELAAFCREACAGVPRAAFYRELLNSLGALDFFGMATLRLEDYMRRNNAVLMSDTGELLRRIISDAEMPFIYERLGMTLETLLIDEFQDTSHLQWHNLRPLVANSISEGHDNLIIGDEKQAIYRFRNSDSELLGSIVQTRDFPDDHVLRGFAAADNTNHRSAPDIVRVNNTLFARMARTFDAPGYGNVVQTPAASAAEKPAYIKVKFFEDAAAAPPETILEAMVQDIIRQHDQGGYRWRDILILTRMRAEAALVVEYLVNNHPEIDVLSSEALLLSSSAAVRTIMSMLGLVEGSYAGKRPDVDDAPRFASNADIVLMITRYNYYHAAGYPAPDALSMALAAEAGAVSLDSEIRAIRAENPANLVALIEAIIAYKLSPEQRAGEAAYITALQDLAVTHLESPDPSIKAFIDAYHQNINRWAIKASADIDAVEVMTVHKSKGLERDCVHIPFADWPLKHGEQNMWVALDGLEGFDPDIVPPVLRVSATTKSALRNPRVSPFAATFDREERLEILENLNTAYVAFTRPVRELCVFSGTKSIGADLLEAFRTAADSAESEDAARIDLATYFDDSTLTFELGEPTHRAAGRKESKTTVYAKSYPVVFNDRTRRLTAIDDLMSEDLAIGGEEPKETVDEPLPGNEAMMEAAHRGNIMHSILASTRTLADLPAAAAEVGRRSGLDSDAIAMCVRELEQAIADGGKEVASWFDPSCKVYAERAIFVAEGELTFRPDRVVIAPDGHTTVLDYKFTTEARPGHFAQVENYINLFRRLGHDKVSGYLWYPLLGVIKRVKPHRPASAEE